MNAREALQALNVRLGQEEGRLTVEFPDKVSQDVLVQAVPLIQTLLKEPGAPTAVSLDLSGTAVTNLAPLAGLSGLQRLDITGTPVRDTSPVAGIPGLRIVRGQDYPRDGPQQRPRATAE